MSIISTATGNSWNLLTQLVVSPVGVLAQPPGGKLCEPHSSSQHPPPRHPTPPHQPPQVGSSVSLIAAPSTHPHGTPHHPTNRPPTTPSTHPHGTPHHPTNRVQRSPQHPTPRHPTPHPPPRPAQPPRLVSRFPHRKNSGGQITKMEPGFSGSGAPERTAHPLAGLRAHIPTKMAPGQGGSPIRGILTTLCQSIPPRWTNNI